MFLIELAMGIAAGSVSLQADALDFLGDAANYGISLSVAGLALYHRARAAMVKGISMDLFGVWVVSRALWHLAHGTVPEADDGSGRLRGLTRESSDIRAPLGASLRRQQHAIGLAVFPE